MKKSDVVAAILAEQKNLLPRNQAANSYAPSNIALCKYWGKRNQELNLPVTSSLSVSLGDKGTITNIAVSKEGKDRAVVNGKEIDSNSSFAIRLKEFLDLFRVQPDLFFTLDVKTNIPIGAGLASSASGFASLVLGLDALFGWNLSKEKLSILARLGSGSAARSIWQGFVEWEMGKNPDGMDSHGIFIADRWDDLCLGLLVVSSSEKKISSREAMQRTVATSPLYAAWSFKVQEDLASLQKAIKEKDFALLGQTAEWNALTMHATMLSAWPAVTYALPETVTTMQKIWWLRNEGLSLYFTQDAGPNLKLLFLEKDISKIKEQFPEVEVVLPFK